MLKNIILILIIVKFVFCANILFVTPIPSPSHHIWSKTLALGLVEKGHNITMLTVESEESINNFTTLEIKGMYDKISSALGDSNLEDHGIINPLKLFSDITYIVSENAHKSDGYRRLLDYPKDKFDLIIFDSSMGRYMYHLIEVFQFPPSVGFTPFLFPPYLSSSFGVYPSTSYDPYYSSRFSNFMSFKERILNFIYTYIDIIYVKYFSYPRENGVLKNYPKTKLSLDELERKLSILFTNTDCILDYPRLLPPNIIPVGGLHARPPKTLPKDIQKIMDEAKNGVILFSLGTNIRSDKLSSSTIDAFLATFSKLSETVLWKFESDLKNVPENVIIREWLPQNDILGHPNTKLFISHGGALSTQEAMYHGIPVIGLPFYADQLINIRSMVNRKLAKELNIFNLTLENIEDALGEVLTNTDYLLNIKKVSRRYRDQPQTALERAVFWMEYVLRHGSVEHLVLPSRDMPFYQIANLEILGFIYFVCLLLFLTAFFIFKFLKFVYKSMIFSNSKIKTC